MNDGSKEQLSRYQSKIAQLQEKFKNLDHINFRLEKKTASNLFRYVYQKNEPTTAVTIKNFDNILSIDKENGILNVEGLTPYEKIVRFTLQHGYLPTVAPELKHITIGGATVGIGIESSGYKYGFVHDGLLEAEVLLPDGKIVLCTPHNEYADLFFALPNSYGTLGYILRAKIKLYPAKPFVRISIKRFNDINIFLNAMQNATNDENINFIEGLVFSQQELYLLNGQFVQQVDQVDDIYRNIFYKLVQNKNEIYLTTEDYIFRYDPDWFWNIPETGFYNILRRFAPKSWRNSGFYKKYLDYKNNIRNFLRINQSLDPQEEKLIQDWEVPWEKGKELLEYALNNIDLRGKPWAIVPIKPLSSATIYPLRKNSLYFNLGCYCYSKRIKTDDPYYNTKIMYDYTFSLGGLKMLYSSTFVPIEQFRLLYNNEAYQRLKQKYDMHNKLGDVFNKVSAIQE